MALRDALDYFELRGAFFTTYRFGYPPEVSWATTTRRTLPGDWFEVDAEGDLAYLERVEPARPNEDFEP